MPYLYTPPNFDNKETETQRGIHLLNSLLFGDSHRLEEHMLLVPENLDIIPIVDI
jgi:hypothetical protein